MTLKLTVLGGAAAWPNPGQGCSAYLVEDSDARILVDCGPDTLLELRRHVQLSGLDAIVISHCHADHMLDLITLRYALVYSEERPNAPISLWVPPGGIAILEPLGEILGSQGESRNDFWRTAFDLREYDPAQVLELESFSLTFRATQHFTACFAIRIQHHSGKSILYGADSGNAEPLVEFAHGADLLISEATADHHDGIPRDERGHLTPEDAGEWATNAGASRLLLTHLWNERPLEEVVRRAASRFDGPIDIATRGRVMYV